MVTAPRDVDGAAAYSKVPAGMDVPDKDPSALMKAWDQRVMNHAKKGVVDIAAYDYEHSLIASPMV